MQVLPQCGHAVHEDNPEKVTFKYIDVRLLVLIIIIMYKPIVFLMLILESRTI